MAKIKTCIICGEEFVADRNQKTCSPECSEKNRRKYAGTYSLEQYYNKKGGRTVEEKCKKCGKTFIKVHRSIYCDDCRGKARKEYLHLYYKEKLKVKRKQIKFKNNEYNSEK